jgi:hypothetical protein
MRHILEIFLDLRVNSSVNSILMQLLTVSQLAKATEVRADTVRYYERIGMISEASRTDSGYRKFDEQ